MWNPAVRERAEPCVTLPPLLLQDFDALPWVYVIPKDTVPAAGFDKLLKLGEFAAYHDKIVLQHDILAEQAASLFKPEVHPSALPVRDLPAENDHPSILFTSFA